MENDNQARNAPIATRSFSIKNKSCVIFEPWIGQLKQNVVNKCKVNEGKNLIESWKKRRF